MKIFHFIIGKANKNRSNGVNQVIAGLCKYSSLNGQCIRVIGLASNAVIEGEIVQRDGFQVEVYSKWSLKLLKALIYNLKWCDILHLHGVYNWSNILVGEIAKRCLTPFVVTAHNGFSPTMSKFRKKLFDFLMQKRFMESAAAVHILAPEEGTDILEICNPKSFIYAPNGIDLDDFPILSSRKLNDGNESPNKPIIIGYLGRISKEKNLFSLVKALDEYNDEKEIILRLAGPKSSYLNDLLSLNHSYEMDWVGAKYGVEKIEFIKSLDLFVHPSKTDVFSISAMECLAIGTPLLITRDSKASYFYDSGAFFMSESTPYGISQGIRDAIDRREEWEEVSSRGRSLISNIFNWNTASLSIIKGYELVLKDYKK